MKQKLEGKEMNREVDDGITFYGGHFELAGLSHIHDLIVLGGREEQTRKKNILMSVTPNNFTAAVAD